MKKHTEIGYNIASASNELSTIAEYILSHHERWDGKGYPQGLKGNEIPKLARIVSIADTYDAMTSERPYKTARRHSEAIAEILRCSGTQFDPQIVEAFYKIFTMKDVA
jgi:HD-GYP domain-containing protein (c-di-GMP phosphodiesterase class II)